MQHSIIRTSPRGKGQKFIGTCTLCGQQNLTLSDRSECPNVRGLSQSEALLEIFDPAEHEAETNALSGVVTWPLQGC